MAVIQAHDDFQKALPRYEAIKKENADKTTKNQLDIIYNKSLVFNFYIKQKKLFNAYFLK